MARVKIADSFDLLIANGGLILKDNQSPAHYWKITIVFALGIPAIDFTDLGTTEPT